MADTFLEVPFEGPEQVANKLVLFEELFKHRYTKEDKWYNWTCSKEERWHQVPVIQPWPPHSCQPRRRRYDDWDSNRKRRGGYRSRGHGWDREFPRDRSYGRHDDSSYHLSRPFGRRSPRPDRYNEKSPLHKGHWVRDSSHSPPPPRKSRSRSPWQQDLSPRKPGSSPRRYDNNKYPERETDDIPPLSSTPLPISSPLTRSAMEPHPQQLNEEESEGEGIRRNRIPLSIDFEEVTGWKETDEKVIPSTSDVLDILHTASVGTNEVTSENLKQVQKITQHHERKMKLLNDSKKSVSSHLAEGVSQTSHTHSTLPFHTTKMLVSHGKTKNVSNLDETSFKNSNLHRTEVISKETVVPIVTKSKSIKGQKTSQIIQQKKRLRKHSAKSILLGEESEIEVAPTNISMNVQPKRRIPSHTDNLDDITQDTDNASLNTNLNQKLPRLDTADTIDTTRHQRSLIISIDQTKLHRLETNPESCISFKSVDDSDTLNSLHGDGELPKSAETYKVEYDGVSTKMIIRSREDKKGKKKHKKKKKHLKKKQLEPSYPIEMGGGSVEFTNPLKVKIKLENS